MPYAVGDKVTLSATFGGWGGYVTDVRGGPGGPLYLVQRAWPEHDRDAEAIDVPEAGIAAGPLAIDAWQVDDAVTLGNEAGIVTAASGGFYSVRVSDPGTIDRVVIYSRTHERVPGWRLDMEN